MAEQKKTGSEAALGMDIDIYNMVKDVLKNWWVILALAVSAALISCIYVNETYRPAYTIEATYVVIAKGINNDVYSNLYTAHGTAEQFSQIINSSTLQNKVAEDLGTKKVPGSVWAEIVPETNLLTLKVTAETPKTAYQILRSVMDSYPTISEYLVGDVFLDVLMAPVIPTEPDNSMDIKTPMRNAFLAAALGLIAVMALFSYLKDTVRKEADVEKKLDVRLLGSLCHEEKNKTLFSKIRRNKNALLLTDPMISFRYGEMLQKTCRRIQNRMDQKGAKTLMVMSCLENEGKSTVAANVSLALAGNGKKVVLVDLDLRQPSQYKIFGQPDREITALGDVLNGEANSYSNLVEVLPDKGIYTVFNTVKYGRSTEMLTTGTLEMLLEYLKEEFDYVIIDTPPMAYVADTEEIAGMADASLAVVREHTSRIKEINDMLDVLSGCRAVPIGCVFNDSHNRMGGTLFRESGYGYGKSYGGYGGYGNYYGKK